MQLTDGMIRSPDAKLPWRALDGRTYDCGSRLGFSPPIWPSRSTVAHRPASRRSCGARLRQQKASDGHR